MGRVGGLSVESEHRHALADLAGQKVGDANDRRGGRARSRQLRPYAAGGDDNHIGALLTHEGRVHFLAGDDVHTFHFQHTGEVVAQTAQALVLALHHFGEVQKAAQAVLLVQRDGVPALGGHARRLHAGRAAANDHDVLVAVGRAHLVALGHGIGEHRVVAGIHAAQTAQAIQAAAAGADLVDAALAQLVGVFRIAVGHGTVHIDHVEPPLAQGVLEVVGSKRRIHEHHAAHGDTHVLLHVAAGAHDEAAAGVRAVEQPAEVAVEVVEGAEAGGAVVAVAGENAVVDKLGLVEGEGTQAQLQGIGASGLEGLTDSHGFLGSVHQRVVAESAVVLLGAVHEHLHHEVRTAALLDAADNLAGNARAVLDGGRAVGVIGGAVVAEAREEPCGQVVAGGIQIDAVEADGLKAGGPVNGVLDVRLDVGGR